MLRLPAICIFLLLASTGVRAQGGVPGKAPQPQGRKKTAPPPRVSLAARFIPGETFRYELEFESETETSRSGLVSDPQGPSSLMVDWNATVRVEVLPSDAHAPGGVHLRTTYEKSSASVRSDAFDPSAAATREQYQALQGKMVEFDLDADGKVQSLSGLEGISDEEKASQSAREWVAQLSAAAGAPTKGVTVGENWSSEEAADFLPFSGLVWRTDSQYLRNEPCHPPNSDLSSASGAVSANSGSAEMCAVILANLSLVRPKSLRDPTPPELRKNGMQTNGVCTGSAQSLTYVSLTSGVVVSVTQTGSEQMDWTLTTSHGASMRYAGTVSTRLQVSQVVDDLKGGEDKSKKGALQN
jgi:hypothetical protein